MPDNAADLVKKAKERRKVNSDKPAVSILDKIKHGETRTDKHPEEEQENNDQKTKSILKDGDKADTKGKSSKQVKINEFGSSNRESDKKESHNKYANQITNRRLEEEEEEEEPPAWLIDLQLQQQTEMQKFQLLQQWHQQQLAAQQLAAEHQMAAQ
jgi:hypothetical protein